MHKEKEELSMRVQTLVDAVTMGLNCYINLPDKQELIMRANIPGVAVADFLMFLKEKSDKATEMTRSGLKDIGVDLPDFTFDS